MPNHDRCRLLLFRSSSWLTGVVLAGMLSPSGFAQLVPDGTLGSQSSTIRVNGSTSIVEGGIRIGGNLFHSFQELNVGSGRSLYFTDPGVTNILTRVTGSNPSNINGKLGVNGNANLFLINPNGILFGAGASLDIRGSFVATTSSAIKFSDGGEFSAINPTKPNLLTIAVPIGLQRGVNQPSATIINQGNLTVGQDLTLAADRLELKGTLRAQRNISLLATDTLRLEGGQVRTQTMGTGNAGTITVGTPEAPVNQVIINGKDSGIFTGTQSGYSGNGNNITLFANSLAITNQAQINATTAGRGNAGNILVRVGGDINLDAGAITGGVTATGTGNGGLIDITARSLSLINSSQIQSQTVGQGRAGDIQIRAENITLKDNFPNNRPQNLAQPPRKLSTIRSGSGLRDNLGGASGDGGDVRITTGSLRLLGDVIISASTFSLGRSGSISVTANDVQLMSGGQISATSESRGNAGSITVLARDRVLISDPPSGLFANTGRAGGNQATGNGGSISLKTGELTMQNRGRITVDSSGLGKGGEIQLFADRITLDDATIFAETKTTQGGNIQIDARDYLLLRHNSLISATAGTAQAGGNGGNITIRGRFAIGVLSENSDIMANAFMGNGGQVDITALGIYGLRFQPQLTPASDITASSRFGLNGTVTLNTLKVDPNQGLVQLPVEVVDSSNQITQTCSAQQQHNSFVITGRGGVAPDPSEALNQTLAWSDGAAETRPARAGGKPANQSEIVEITGWVKHPDGSTALVADPENSPLLVTAQSCQMSPNLEKP